MTVFSNNPYDRRMERLMMTVPNLAPRGVGFRFTERYRSDDLCQSDFWICSQASAAFGRGLNGSAALSASATAR